MTKKERIAQLERDLAGCRAERDALRSTAAAYQRRLREVEAPKKRLSLADEAKRRVAEVSDRILMGLGF